MDQKKLLEAIDGSIKMNKNKRYLIEGEWGIGKYYIINELDKRGEKEKIIISLFGKNSIESILDEIKLNVLYKYIPIDDKVINIPNAAEIFKKIFKIDYKFSKLINIKNVLSNYIIIFDDLERKSPDIKIIDILGIIEQFSDKNTIILIVNKSKIEDKERDEFEKNIEKIIEKKYILDEISSETIKNIVDDRATEINSKILIDNIKEANLIKNETKNLRTFIKFLNLCIELQESLRDVELDKTIVKICEMVILKDVEKKEYNLHVIENREKYLVSYIEEFYFNSQLNENIKRYLENNIDRELNEDEINNNLSNFLFQKKDVLRSNCKIVIEKLQNKKFNYFKDIESFCEVIIYILYLNNKFNFNFEEDKIFEYIDEMLYNACDNFPDCPSDIEWNQYDIKKIEEEDNIYNKMYLEDFEEINSFGNETMIKINKMYNDCKIDIATSYVSDCIKENYFNLRKDILDFVIFEEELIEDIFDKFVSYSDNENYIDLLYYLKRNLVFDKMDNIDKMKVKIRKEIIDEKDEIKMIRLKKLMKFILKDE